MKKSYSDKNVYEASMERIKYIFDNFDHVYVSFSGGKDSGVMLNLVLKYLKDNQLKRKIACSFSCIGCYIGKSNWIDKSKDDIGTVDTDNPKSLCQ